MDFNTGYGIALIAFLFFVFLYSHNHDLVYITTYRIAHTMMNSKGDPLQQFIIEWRDFKEFRDDIFAYILMFSVILVSGFLVYIMWGVASPRSVDLALALLYSFMVGHWIYYTWQAVSQEIFRRPDRRGMGPPSVERIPHVPGQRMSDM